jgi:tetratricopeptide (TPR) repeat protein
MTVSKAGTSHTDAVLADLIDEIMQKQRRGEPVSLAAYAAEYPDHVQQLQELLPALQALADLSHSACRDGGSRSRAPGAASREGEEKAFRGGTLGDFRILGEIGRGGMGVVYEAEQISLGRRVALKVLPFAAVLDPRHLQRFKNEAQAAAALEHPNIVNVHAVGCERGVHYYAMQFIDGQTLAQVIEELRQQGEGGAWRVAGGGTRPPAELATEALPSSSSLTPSPSHPVTPSLPGPDTSPKAAISTQRSTRTPEFFRSVANLGIQAAEALEHAHQMGVVHRDIKPSNLMVDARGHLWIADFGLAQISAPSPLGGESRGEGASLTMTGDILGTLRYMSPEQAAGRSRVLDHHTDVYSLGLTLYELLALQPAFEGDDRQHLVRQILEADPPPPRQHNPSIPRDLETIVLKATAKEPSQRYASAQAFADDLRRFLEDKPIHARRPSLADRLGKWARRHKALVASAACIAATVLVATTLVALSQGELAGRRLRVQQGINDALAEVTRLRGQAQAAALGDQTALAQAREQLQRAVALAETGPAAPEVVAQVQGLLTELDQEQRDRQLLAALDKAWLARADMVGDRFATEASISVLRKALEAYGLPVGKGPPEDAAATIRTRSPAVRQELLAALEEWRAVARRVGVRWRKAAGGDLIDNVTPDSPAGRDGRLKPGDRVIGIGQGRDGAIVDTRAMAPSEVRKLWRGEPGTILRLNVIPKGGTEARIYEIERDPAVAWLKAVADAADTDPWRRRLREALDVADEAKQRAALEKLADEADVERQPARIVTRLADELAEVEAVDQAIALLRKVRQKHTSDFVANMRLALTLQQSKPPQLEEAVRFYTAAITLRPDSAGLHNNLANSLRGQGKLDEAVAEYREAIRLKPDYVFAHSNLGVTLYDQRKPEEAMAELREAIRLRRDYAAAHNNLGWMFYNQRKFEEAIGAFREAIRVQPHFADAHRNLGKLLIDQGKLTEAIAACREAIRLEPDSADAHNKLGCALARQGNRQEATAEYREAIRLQPDLADAHSNLGAALGEQAKRPEAIAECREAIRLKPDHAGAHYNLGMALFRQGKREDGITELRDAVRLEPDNGIFHCGLGDALRHRGNLDEAAAAYREAIRLKPDYAPAYNNFACLLLNAADSRWQQPAEAVELAKKAVALEPKSHPAWNTLGVAQYRAGDHKAAVETLGKAMEYTSGGDANDWLFLAMAHWQLGHKDEARTWYDKAVQWMEKNKPKDEELLRFRAEAAELLGIGKK